MKLRVKNMNWLLVVFHVVLQVPLDEVIDEVFNSLLQLRSLQGDRITLVGDLQNQFPQFVQLALDLEETLGCQSEPERGHEGIS